MWDSDAHDEWRETEHKSRVLARAGKPLKLLETMAWTPEGGVSLGNGTSTDSFEPATTSESPSTWTRSWQLLNTVRSDTPVLLRLLVDAAGTPDLEVRPAQRRRTTDPAGRHRAHRSLRRIPRPQDHDRRRYEEARNASRMARRHLVEPTRGTDRNLHRQPRARDRRAMLTPDHSERLLAGTLREELLDRGQITESTLTLDDLDRADKIFTINSVRGWDQIPYYFGPSGPDKPAGKIRIVSRTHLNAVSA